MKKLTAEKCRDQFETHIRNLDGDYNLIMVGEVYIDVETQIEWRTWQVAWNKALEISLPILEQQELGDGWIEWGGGKCPVPASTPIEVKFRNGVTNREDTADGWGWEYAPDYPRFGDIIAYRIIPEQPTNQNGEQ